MRHAVVLAVLFPSFLFAQDIGGDWQGTIKTERLVITIAKRPSGGWTASEFTPDDGSNPSVASSVDFDGSTLRIGFDTIRGTYEGVLSKSRKTFNGTWIQGSPVPLNLDLATEESSWRRDRTPHKIHFIEVDANVRLEVVDWGGSGKPLILLAGGNNSAHEFDKFAPKLGGISRLWNQPSWVWGLERTTPDTGKL